MDDQTRRELERQVESESRWLQRTLFALGKAPDARAKHAEISGDRLEEIIHARVATLMEDLGQRQAPRA